MSFEPRLVSPDDGPGYPEARGELPPELDALAGRLRAEAAALADCYPGHWSGADKGNLVRAARLRPARRLPRWMLPVAFAAASLLVLATAWGVWRVVTLPTGDGPEMVQSDAAGAADRPSTLSAVAREGSASEADGRWRATRWDGAETLLMGVSGPELEAVLDLMETQGTQPSPLSI